MSDCVTKVVASEAKLHHLEIHATKNGDGHALQHHFHDGSVEQHEFDHPEQNAEALAHIAHHIGMDGGAGDNEIKEWEKA